MTASVPLLKFPMILKDSIIAKIPALHQGLKLVFELCKNERRKEKEKKKR